MGALLGMKWQISWQKTGSEHPFIGPDPACGISVGVVKKTVRDWTSRQHKEYWESLTGLRQAEGLIQGPSARRTKDLLRLNRDQLRWVVGLLNRTLSPKRIPFQIGTD
jgi:hypothetical protein